MKPSEILKKALEKIANPATFCRVHLAEDVYGLRVNCVGPKAVRWCSVGALIVVTPKDSHFEEIYALDYLRSATSACLSIGAFNDTQPHEKIVEAFQQAIQAAKADRR